MEKAMLLTPARDIIAGFKNSDNSVVLENWKTLVSNLNHFDTYSDVPYCPELPLAMYMYVMKYSSKRAEENAIRVITTIGLLMNAVENTEGAEKLDFLALISSLLTYYKKRFKNLDDYSIFPITVPTVKEYFNETVTDYGNTAAYYDSIFLYIYNHVNSSSQTFFGDDEIRNNYNSNKAAFFDEYKQNQHDFDDPVDGEKALRDCYNRMNQVGKCPIFVSSSNNTEIYNKTYGLIPQNITFNVTKFFMQETSGAMLEGELNSQLNIDMQEGNLVLTCRGMDEQCLKSELSLPIKDNYVRKIQQRIELNFNIRNIFRDSNNRLGNIDNIPISMDLHFEHFKLTQIVLTFIVGDKGWMRNLHLYGMDMN